MANLKVCDVCHAKGEIRPSTWRVGYKQPHMKLDVCDEHKNVAKGKSAEEWDRFVLKLLYGEKD